MCCPTFHQMLKWLFGTVNTPQHLYARSVHSVARSNTVIVNKFTPKAHSHARLFRNSPIKPRLPGLRLDLLMVDLSDLRRRWPPVQVLDESVDGAGVALSLARNRAIVGVLGVACYVDALGLIGCPGAE